MMDVGIQPLRNLLVNKASGIAEPLTGGCQTLPLGDGPLPWQTVSLSRLQLVQGTTAELSAVAYLVCLKLDAVPSEIEWTRGNRVERKTYAQEDIVCIPPGDIGRLRFLTGGEILMAAIEPDKIFAEMRLVDQCQDALAAGYLLAMHDEAVLGCVGGAVFGDTIAGSFIAHLVTSYSTMSGGAHNSHVLHGRLPSQSLRAVMDHVRANHNRELSLSEMAALVHRSPYHFARCFKLTTGLSPYQYVTRYRLARARRLLAENPQSTMGEVARQVGYRNARDLNRAFKRSSR